MTDEADHVELTETALVIDCHNDTLVNHIRRGNLSLQIGKEGASERHDGTVAFVVRYGSYGVSRKPDGDIQINFAKMSQGGIDAAFFAVDVTRAYKSHLAYALDAFGYLLNDIEQTGADVVIVRRTDDILQAKAENRPAVILAIENADCVERSLNVLRSLYEIGVRCIGFSWNWSSWAADGAWEARDGVGLTHFGQRLVQEMNRLGILVDLAHVSASAFFNALDVTTKPAIVSHANARAICDHPCNLTDLQLRALGDNGGVIGITCLPAYVDKEDATLVRLLDHIDHVVDVAGVDSVGLGCDFDGGGSLLADATQVSRLTKGLLKRRYSALDIRKILGGNVLRVLKEAIG
jgi:membrane dipeptidase